MTTTLSPGTFFGRTEGSIEVAGLTFAESVYAAEFATPIHEHVDAYFYFVVEGDFEERYGQRSRAGGRSSLVYHPAGFRHSNRWLGPGGRVIHIDITQSRAESIRGYATIVDESMELGGGAGPLLAGRLYKEFRVRDDVSKLVMEALALELLAEASRHRMHEPERTPPRWLVEARDLLHDRFAEDLGHNEIAESVGVHPVHFARTFRKHYHCTPGDFQRRLRVEFACRLLAETDTPLIEIALEAGFSDQSHFTRAFGRRMRMTPGEFRKRFQSR
jgi:AraC family transcriptional regulator